MAFLEAIKANNNRPYFQEHKKDYETAKADFEEITNHLIEEMRAADPQLEPQTAKDCVYRFYRDTRFSEDKSPYKRHMGAFVAPHGARRSLFSGYYLHLQPGNSMIATGVYWLDKPVLKRVRDVIVYDYNEWKEVVEAAETTKIFGSLNCLNRLKRAPLGYPADCEGIDYLKMKDFMFSKTFTDEEVAQPDFVEKVISDFKATIAFNTYINEIMLG